MPPWTPQQRAAMDAVLAGTFDKLDSSPKIQPGYSVDQIYAGILPAAAPVSTANASYRAPMPTPAQLAAMDYVGANAYQAPKNTPIQAPNQPYGFSYADTGDKGRATPAMRQQLAIGLPTNAPMPIPAPPGTPWNTLTSIDQAAIQKFAQSKPTGPVTPSWTTIGPLMAQAAFRQNAFQKTNPLPAPAPARAAAVNTPWGQLSQQLFRELLATQQPPAPGKAPVEITVRGGKTTPSQNYSLANALGAVTKQGATGTSTNGYNYVNGQNVGQSAQYAGMSPSQMYDAINAKAGNPTSSGNSSSLNSMGSSPQEGGTPDWVAHARPLYDSQGNISGWAKNVR